MAGTYTTVLLHIVFSTKNRIASLLPEVREKTYAYMGGIIRKRQCALYEIGGTADHVHLAVRIHPDEKVTDLIRDLKRHTSVWIHETFPKLGGFSWQGGYGAFSVSASNMDAVKQYIRGQEAHHQKRTFQEEFVEFLKVHGIDFDPEQIWK